MKDFSEGTAANGLVEAAPGPSAKNWTNEMDPSSESPSMPMFNSSDGNTNSCNASLDTLKDIDCNRGLESLDNVEISHGGVTQRVQKRQWQHLYQLSGNFRSRVFPEEVNAHVMCIDPLTSKKEQERPFLNRSSDRQKGKGIDEIPKSVVYGGNKLISGDRLPLEHYQSKIESFSNFGKLFGRQSLKITSSERGGPAGHDASMTMALSRPLVASSSGKTSDAEIKPGPSSNQHSSRSIERGGPAGHDASMPMALSRTLVASSSGKTSNAEIKPGPSSNQRSSRSIERGGPAGHDASMTMAISRTLVASSSGKTSDVEIKPGSSLNQRSSRSIESGGPAGHDVSMAMAISRTLVASSSGKTSDVEIKTGPSSDQRSSCSIERPVCILPQGQISLREWIELCVSHSRKAERLHLFRKIVELVGISHQDGFVLQELRPSNFIFVAPDIIKYIGSSNLVHSTTLENQSMSERRMLKTNFHVQSKSGVKRQKLDEDRNWIRLRTNFTSSWGVNGEAMLESYKSDLQGHDDTAVQMEKSWYSCQNEIDGNDLFSSNIYSLGVLFFELFCPFESSEEHFEAMVNLSQLVLPTKFLSKSPKEAGFCFWLLHPKPSSRPTTREILKSEATYCSDETCLSNDLPSHYKIEEDSGSELLIQFLISMEEQKQKHASSLLQSIECLDANIKEVRRRHVTIMPSNPMNKDIDNGMWDLLPESCSGSEIFETRCPVENVLQKSLTKNINELGKAYFSMRSKLQVTEVDRTDKDLLSNRDMASKNLNTERRPTDQAGTFFDGVCMFARYRQFELCGSMRSDNLLSCTNVLCSLSFDRDEDYIAVAGFSKKIKIFEFGSLLNDSDDIEYSILQMSNKSKLTCVCWNKYFKQYLASTDYDGAVQIWDVSSGQAFVLYNEHQKRTWSVDFSLVDPTKFATGSDDCSVKLWCTTEKNSTSTIWNPANICCVQFSAFSSHILAFGSADHKVYCYDIRNLKIPWCTLAGHGKTISHVKFLDSETLVSASTDNTLKLWDLKKTTMEGLSSDACSLTFSGHSNQKNFVGLSVLDGHIACGSETNEVYAYHRSFPVPIASHKFGSVDPLSGVHIDDSIGQFVTSVCWRRKSDMLVSANSGGRLNVLRLV